MSHHQIREDDDDDDWGEPSSDSDDLEYDSDEDAEWIDCPNCNRPIYDDSQQCPYCQYYITGEEERGLLKVTDSPFFARFLVFMLVMSLIVAFLWLIG